MIGWRTQKVTLYVTISHEHISLMETFIQENKLFVGLFLMENTLCEYPLQTILK